jgi:isopenicillin N synthase-like dioxygenase
MQVPVIDLSLSDPEIVPALQAACKDVGFFYVIGHDVPDEDFKTLFADMQRFFALDPGTKTAVCTTTNSHNRGWTPLGEETLDPARQSCGDTKEG